MIQTIYNVLGIIFFTWLTAVFVYQEVYKVYKRNKIEAQRKGKK